MRFLFRNVFQTSMTRENGVHQRLLYLDEKEIFVCWRKLQVDKIRSPPYVVVKHDIHRFRNFSSSCRKLFSMIFIFIFSAVYFDWNDTTTCWCKYTARPIAETFVYLFSEICLLLMNLHLIGAIMVHKPHISFLTHTQAQWLQKYIRCIS